MASRTAPSEALAAWIAGRRWYATRTRRIAGVRVVDELELPGGLLVVAGLTLDDGTEDRYALALRPDPAAVAEVVDDPAFGRALLDLALGGGRRPGRAGALHGVPAAGFRPSVAPHAPLRRLGGEQSNTSVAFGQAVILKLFRRLAEGPNPEEEMTRLLTARGFPHAPRLAGHLEYRAPGAGPTTVAVVQELIPDARDGWEWTLETLGRALAAGPAAAEAAGGESAAARLVRPTLDGVRRLGEVTGRLHRTLAAETGEPAFAPEAIDGADLVRWAGEVQAQLERARRVLGNPADLPPAPDLQRALAGLRGRQRIRHHGDLHLGQTLYRPATGDFVLIDFEGEPLRPLAERRRKHAALRDLAGLLRSLDYAAAAALRAAGPGGDGERRVEGWRRQAAGELVAGYRQATGGARFLPPGEAELEAAVAVFELEKAAYEVVYEANHRPDWLDIPRRGLIRAAARLASGPTAGAA